MRRFKTPCYLVLGVSGVVSFVLYYVSARSASMSFHPSESFLFSNSPPTESRVVLYRADSVNCTLEYINTAEIPQDDECLVHIIRTQFIYPPSTEKLQLLAPHVHFNSQGGQTQRILRILNNKTEGFYIESGAFDGELYSNTLYLERFLNWEGILIEPIPNQWKKILAKKRHAWVIPAGLSSTPFPQKLRFRAQHVLSKALTAADPKSHHPELEVQCFPLYSILLALGMEKKHIDYFSLDVEGAELDILRSTPWGKLDIQTLTVEFGLNSDTEQPSFMRKFMAENKYRVAEIITDQKRVSDYVFVKD